MLQTHAVQAVLQVAFRTAEARSSAEHVAIGVIAALRRLHAAVHEAGGEAMASFMRATLRDVILARNLECLRETTRVPQPVPLPAPTPSARFAIAVLEDAANSCLMLNALTPDNGCLHLAIRLLAERLIDTLGGAPDYGTLADRLADATALGQPTALVAPTGARPILN
jgi:hypothetical protein